MSKSIYEQEKNLFNDLRFSLPEELREKIVDDGLCWASISDKIPVEEDNFWPENLWVNSTKRILFLLKEPNGNEGDDYKCWDWSIGNELFGNVISLWLEGIQTTTKDYCPSHKDLSHRKDIFKKYPFAIVNVKKEAGDATADWNEIWEHAELNKDFLIKQIREILKPNIIVCGGSNDSGTDNTKMITIAKDIIFEDEKDNFEKINNWCHYNKNLNVLLIDSYHPSYPKLGFEDKVDQLLLSYHNFLKTLVLT